MPTYRIRVPIYLPAWLYDLLRKARQATAAALDSTVDLFGDREIEWSFIASRLPNGPGQALDFGASFGSLSIVAAQRGLHVLATDLDPERFPWKHPNVDFLCGDLFKLNLPSKSFDVIMNCSAVEHVGLPGRYGINLGDANGDLKAMRRFLALLKPSGRMLMTIPCGKDTVVAPWHRVYGSERLPRLLDGYQVEEQSYWVKHADNRWYPCDLDTALAFTPSISSKKSESCSYALGCFVLRPEDSGNCSNPNVRVLSPSSRMK